MAGTVYILSLIHIFNKQDLLTGGFSGKLQVGALKGQTMDVKISLAVSAKDVYKRQA